MERAYIRLYDCIYAGGIAVKSRPCIYRGGYLCNQSVIGSFSYIAKTAKMARRAFLTMSNVFIPKMKLKRVGTKYERITGVYYER